MGIKNFFFRMKMNGQFVPSVKHIVLQEHITVGMLKVISFLVLCDTVALRSKKHDWIEHPIVCMP